MKFFTILVTPRSSQPEMRKTKEKSKNCARKSSRSKGRVTVRMLKLS